MSAKREVIAGPDVPPALGPYSAGVRAGDTLYVAGQAGLDPATGEPAGPTFEEQARQAMLVVNTTVLVADISEFGVVNQIFGETFPTDPPARMTMQMPLPHGLLISVGAVALVDAG
jgi:2-iminobutanoate/2-iminopropanoate deaminase